MKPILNQEKTHPKPGENLCKIWRNPILNQEKTIINLEGKNAKRSPTNEKKILSYIEFKIKNAFYINLSENQ